MNRTDLYFGTPGWPRGMVLLSYAVAVLAGVLFGLISHALGVLILLTSIGILVVGTLKEYREEQDDHLSDE